MSADSPIPDPFELAIALRDKPARALVERLRELHAKGERRARPSRRAAPGTGSRYDEARRRFYAHESVLREQVSLADEIVRQVLPPSAQSLQSTRPALQQELRLQTVPRGRAAGRFVLANELTREIELELEIGALCGAPAGFERSARVSLDPLAPCLAIGEERVMRIEIDLADCPAEAGVTLELALDIGCAGALLAKIWVAIELRESLAAGDER